MNAMLGQLRPALVALLTTTLLTGLAYPLAITGVAEVVFPRQARGSIIVRDGKAIGSELIGQDFRDEKYFWPRPSATTPRPYTALDRGAGGCGAGSNLGPLHPALHARVAARIGALRAAHPENAGPIPIDLVTASASGLDPHISPAAAEYQAARVARVRGVPLERIRELIGRHTSPRALGMLGEPTVHVLKLNLALDEETH